MSDTTQDTTQVSDEQPIADTTEANPPNTFPDIEQAQVYTWEDTLEHLK